MPHREVEGYPSVTQVLSVINKPFLLRWYGTHGNAKCEKIKKQSQTFGTRVHGEIERLLKGCKPKSKNVSIRSMVQNFNEQFIKPYKVRAVSIEPSEPLTDSDFKYSGTYDAVIDIVKDNLEFPVIADWKTSNQQDNTWPLQLAAYAYLYNGTQGETNQINDGMVVRLDKKTLQTELFWYTDLDQYLDVFFSCLSLYNYLNKKGLWNEG